MIMRLRIAAVFVVGSVIGTSSAYIANSQHNSASSFSSSSSSSHQSRQSYSSQSANGPGYSYSYSYSDGGGSPLFFPKYAARFHSYTPLFLSSIDFPIDFDLDDDLDPDLDFDIDTDLDLDIDLDFPGIGYGLGYIGKYGHWFRKPKYGFSKLYSNINGDFWNYGGHYGYDHLGLSNFGPLNFFK